MTAVYLCPICHRDIVTEARGGPHPSPGDHDPAYHVAKAYGTTHPTVAGLMDRTYFRFATAWHALDDYKIVDSYLTGIALCSREHKVGPDYQKADRVPAAGHLCGNCSRIIAARTDIEISTVGSEAEHARARQMAAEHGPDRVSDVPEPVASEQDDSGIAPI